MRVGLVAAAGLLAGCSLVVVLPSASHAVTHSSSGARCTLVGTPKADVLRGTARRDVICGLGGDDRIDGLGGNDVLDGGAGDDLILGGPGDDRIDGGSGNDVVHGEDGADAVHGGGGADQLHGSCGNDRLYGGPGDDVIAGDCGDDLVAGGSGDDRLNGGSQDDRVLGDAGDDIQAGGVGDDMVSGSTGDDDLAGGRGADDVDGGSGFNVCDDPDAAGDQQVHCVVDAAKPVVEDVTPTPATVDVSEDAQTIRIEAHVTDDTGVRSVQIGSGLADLVSGTLRDGIWGVSVVVPRYIAPGPRELFVDVRDRVGRTTSDDLPAAYTVIDDHSDQEMPVLRALHLSTSSVDVRTDDQAITATIHVTDDLAGATDVYLCAAHAYPTGQPSFRQAGPCAVMRQTSGDRADSTWKGTYDVPQGSVSGTWDTEVWISDAAGRPANDFWYGPDELAAIGPNDEPRYRAIPGGAGVFTVKGTPQDLNAPVLTSLALTPSTVDTSTGAVRVTADISGTDVEGMTDASIFINGYPGYPDNPTWADTVQIAWVQHFKLVSGTPQDGTWRATFVVPGGTPDGEYFIQATIEDSSHFESWISPNTGWSGDDLHPLTTDLAPGGLYFVVANS